MDTVTAKDLDLDSYLHLVLLRDNAPEGREDPANAAERARLRAVLLVEHGMDWEDLAEVVAEERNHATPW
jgi:hypothetical protein